MKPLVIYPADCPDGFGAAFTAWTVLGDETEYVPLGYDAGIGIGQLAAEFHTYRLVDMKGNFYVISTPEEKRDVYILDFSFKKPIMDFIFAHAKRVVWLDHHKSAFEMWCGGLNSDRVTDGVHRETMLATTGYVKAEIVLDNNKSGAYLAWEYFHPGTEVPMLIQHIDDYDRWQFKIEGTKAFNKALWSYAPWSFEQWKELNRQLENYDDHGGDFPHFIFKEGSAILRAHDQNVQSVMKGSARKCSIAIGQVGDWSSDFEGTVYEGLAANCPHHLTSDVGHELAVRSGTFGLCWTLANEGHIAKCSLRSNGNYDISSIAKSFRGGGHCNAAGFEVPMETLLGWLK